MKMTHGHAKYRINDSNTEKKKNDFLKCKRYLKPIDCWTTHVPAERNKSMGCLFVFFFIPHLLGTKKDSQPVQKSLAFFFFFLIFNH